MSQKFTDQQWRNKKRLLIVLSLLFFIIIGIGIWFNCIIGSIRTFLPNTLSMTGFGSTKTYLVVLQNNDELRPTGGFISAYGILKMRLGIPSIKIYDSYHLSNTSEIRVAPSPFRFFLKNDPKFLGWYFRDGNFNPDFSQSAQKLISLYNEQCQDEPLHFDGVFALNFNLIEDLMKITGPFKINDQEVNSQNIFSFLQFQIKNIDKHDIEDLKNRKNILSSFGKQLIKQLIFSPSRYSEIFDTINQGLNEKKIVLYFNNKFWQNKVSTQNWGGEFRPNLYPNFIYVNTANIGGRKADRYLKKNHRYLIKFDKNGTGIVNYSLNIEHLGSYNLHSDVYQAYHRVYLPQLAKITDFKGDVLEWKEVSSEQKKYVEFYQKLLPGEKQEIKITFILPPDINLNNFSLNIHKQSGTEDFWEVIAQLPNDQSFSSPEFTIHENLGIWQDQLKTDKYFSFIPIKDQTPPIIAWQKFIKSDTIEVNFSEAIDPESLTDLNNFYLTDLDYINDQTDQISIKSVKLNSNYLHLKFDGINRAEEERYLLFLNNIHDLSGNYLDPNPMKITVVQRLNH